MSFLGKFLRISKRKMSLLGKIIGIAKGKMSFLRKILQKSCEKDGKRRDSKANRFDFEETGRRIFLFCTFYVGKRK